LATDTSPQATRGGSYTPKHTPRKEGEPRRGLFRRFWWVLVAVPVVVVLAVGGALVYAYSQIELPKALPPIQSTFMYDRNGSLLASIHGAVDRTIIPFDKMPEHLRDAVIAVEDHGFYEHPGIDPVGILRAAWTDLVKHTTVQGGSTITQQLVKQVYAGSYVEQPDGTREYVVPPRTIKEKIREALLAIKLEKTLSKDQILARYLNTIYLGHGAYGVQAAAQTYWGIDAADLNVKQSATLAGLITSPGRFDPIDHPEDSAVRRNYALDQMVQYGYLDGPTADRLKAKKVTTAPTKEAVNAPANSEYFVDYAKRYLIDRYGGAAVFGGGYRVTTSLDLGLQRAAEAAVNAHLPSPSDPEGALVAIDPSTGEILAMVGGRGFNQSQVNLAVSGLRLRTETFGGTGRQAGSAFKPFTLAAAMKAGYNLNAYWQGPSSITIPNTDCYTDGAPWELSNASDSEAGTFSLKAATAHSVNTVFAQVTAQLGPQKVVDMAHLVGIRSHLDPVCSITLGVEAVNPLEMTNAYATLAAHGVRRYANPLVQLTNHNGKVVDDVSRKPKQVLDANDADLVTYALEDVVTYGTGTVARLSDRPVAGKTGTAQDYVDAWFCGYTPQLATCVWVGYPKGEIPLESVEGVSPVFGGTIPAAIWHDFMTVAMQGQPVESFAVPSFDGHTIGPATPVPSPIPSPSPTPSPSEPPSPEPTGPTGPTGPSPTGPTGATGAGPTGPTGQGGTGPTGPIRSRR
jgi:penicillin-binding protein 1A